MATQESTENRLRRTALRRGMRLEKCRRRDPKAVGFGRYSVIGCQNAHPPFSLTLEDVERVLNEEHGKAGLGTARQDSAGLGQPR